MARQKASDPPQPPMTRSGRCLPHGAWTSRRRSLRQRCAGWTASRPPDNWRLCPLAAGHRTAGRKSSRVRIAIAAAVVGVLAGGTTVAAANANPGSPLWSISQVINPARAHRLAAEDALAEARQAIADKHPAQAAQLLDKAAKLIADVRDPQQAARLRAELAELEQLLISATPGVTLPGTSPDPQPSSSPSGTPHPSPAPSSTKDSGSGLPGHLPSLLPEPTQAPLPPVKSLLPTTLPSLPLPGLGG